MGAEEVYRCLIENQEFVVFQLDAQGVLTNVSPAVEHFSGYSVAEVIGQPFGRFAHPDDLEEIETRLRGMSPGASSALEFRALHKNGSVLWLRGSSRYSSEEPGGPIIGIFTDITARKGMEEALRQAGELNRQIIASANEGIAVLDRDLRYVSWNPFLEKLSGLSENQVRGKVPWQVFPILERYGVPGILQKVLGGESAVLPELQVFSADGSDSKWIAAEYDPLRDAQGNVNGVLVSIRDITEHRLAVEQIREAAELNRQIIAGASDGIVVLDREFKHKVWNSFLEKTTGLSPDQISGRKPWEIFPELAKYGVQELLARTLRGEFTIAPDMQILPPGATEVQWIAAEHSPLRDGRGNITGVIVTIHDVTWRRKAEQALRESEDRYRDLAENSQDLLCTHDLQGKLVWLNAAPARSLGYTVEEMTGKSLRDFIDPAYESQLDEYLIRIQRDKVAKPYFAVLTRSGEQRVWECHNTLRTEGVPAPIVRGMARDVTERIRAEQRLRQSEERFRVALKSSPIKVFNQDRDLRYTWVHNLPPGLSESDYLGHTDAEIFSPEDASAMTAIKQAVVETGVGTRQEITIHFHGQKYYCDLTVEPLRDSGGTVQGVTCACLDITELHEKTEQLSTLSKKLAQEKLYLESELEAEHKFEEIVGESAPLREALSQIQVVAATDSTVLVLGETGTGKELVARAVHRMSARSNNSFIKLNCAAIPTGLLESELFGHEKGAFTGAVSQKIGRLELADKGTLFLDEVGDIPLELQPKLLRVIQDQEFERLGGTRTIRVNARLIAATNRDLSQRVAERQFRSDLFYRLNVFPIRVPALRDRKDDIPALVRHFVHKYASRMNKHIESVPREAQEALTKWNWPGNVRELENFIERSVILTGGTVLHVPLSEFKAESLGGDDNLEAAERDYIIRILRECHGIIAGPKGAAVRLGLKRTTLQSKMQRLGISRSDYESESRGGRTGS